MSIERAYRACKLCFKYSKLNLLCYGDLKDTGNKYIEFGMQYLKFLELWNNAEFEAMKGLEETMNACSEVSGRTGIDYHITIGPKADEALKACRDCDYSSPKIMDMLKEEK